MKTLEQLKTELNKDGRRIAYHSYVDFSPIAAKEAERIAKFQNWTNEQTTEIERALLLEGRIFKALNKRGFIYVLKTEENESFHDWDQYVEVVA
jgi:hypothetical protein